MYLPVLHIKHTKNENMYCKTMLDFYDPQFCNYKHDWYVSVTPSGFNFPRCLCQVQLNMQSQINLSIILKVLKVPEALEAILDEDLVVTD